VVRKYLVEKGQQDPVVLYKGDAEVDPKIDDGDLKV